MRALNKIALTSALSTFMHRIEVTLPEGASGFALDSMSGNVITRVKDKSPADMVGIVSGCMLQEINGVDTTVMTYEDTIQTLRSAEKPLTLTLKSKTLLEAKLESGEGIPPSKLLASERPQPGEFEIKLRNTTQEDLHVIKSGNDFVINQVKADTMAAKKGVHVYDEIIGINGMECVGHQVRGFMDTLYGEGGTGDPNRTRKVALRLRHHGEKFPKIRKSCGPKEFDLEYKEFPFGLEFSNSPILPQYSFVTKSEKGSFSDLNNVKKGDDLIGVDGQNVYHQSWNVVKHVIANARYPMILRFRKMKFSDLPDNIDHNLLVMKFNLAPGPSGCNIEEHVNVHGHKGSRIISFAPDSQAAERGVQVGDFVVGINNYDVSNASHDSLMKCFVTTPKPMVLRVFRGDIDLFRSNAPSSYGGAEEGSRFNVVLEFGEGPLGLSMEEVQKKYCEVTDVKKQGQGHLLGVLKTDRIIQVGGQTIPESANAFSLVLDTLQSVTRPVVLVLSRSERNSPENRAERKAQRDAKRKAKLGKMKNAGAFKIKKPTLAGADKQGDNASVAGNAAAAAVAKSAELRVEKIFTLQQGSLGMQLKEDEVTKASCRVLDVIEKGQGWNVGFMVDDVIVSVQGNIIPKDQTAMDKVMDYLQTLPRPIDVVVSRLKSTNDNAVPRNPKPDWFDPTRPLSTESWGKEIMHLPAVIRFNQYEARWPLASTYEKSGMKLKEGPTEGSSVGGTRVQIVGSEANSKKGLQTLDKLIGIQTADVENETTPDVQSYLKQAIEHGGHNRALVFRFQHHEDKFKKIQEEALNDSEYEVTFATHPLDGGLEILERTSRDGGLAAAGTTEVRVHNCVEGSFAALHDIRESDVIIGVGDYDVRGVEYASVFHVIKHATRPVSVRMKRYKDVPLPDKAPEGQIDAVVKKKYIDKQLLLEENEDQGGAYVSKVKKVKNVKKGMIVIGLDGMDVSRHEWAFVRGKVDEILAKKKVKEIKFRFGPTREGTVDDGDYDEEKDGGMSLRMMLKMKKKYKSAKKVTPPKSGQYDVVFPEGPSGMMLCVAPNQKDEDGQVGAIVYSTTSMDSDFQTTISCGDRLILVNNRDVENGIYSEIDSLLFEQLGPTEVKLRFAAREKIPMRAELEDKEKELEVEVVSEDLHNLSFGESYDDSDEDLYCCILELDPEPDTPLGALGLKSGVRVVAYDGISCLNIPVPGVVLHLTNLQEGIIPSSVIRFRSKVPIEVPEDRPDIPLAENQHEFYVEDGPLGMSLKETEDMIGCCVATVAKDEQGERLGFQVDDEFLHLNNKLIPGDDTAFDVTMGYLQSEPRPLRVVVLRTETPAEQPATEQPATKQQAAETPPEDQELAFVIQAGPLGMTLKEVEGNKGCAVNAVKEGSQAHTLGFQANDEIISVNEKLIPFDEEAFDIVMGYLKSEPRPTTVLIFRPGIPEDGEIPLYKNELRFTLPLGNLGFALASMETGGCCIGKVKKKGLAKKLGLKTKDEIISINNILIEHTSEAESQAMKLLINEQRPCPVVVYRRPPSYRKSYIVEAGPLGMSLMEGEGHGCYVAKINSGSQSERKGFLQNDVIVQVGDEVIPSNRHSKQMDHVMSLLSSLPRPLSITVERQGEAPTVAPPEEKNNDAIRATMNTADESKDEFAKKYKKKTGDVLFRLPDDPGSLEYTVRFKPASNLTKSSLVFGESVDGDSEVVNHGNAANLKKGIQALDKLIGIQMTKVQGELHEVNERLLEAAVVEANNGPVVLRFEHHTSKFQPLPKEPENNDFDIKFTKHPFDEGIDVIEMDDSTVVAHVENNSWSDKQMKMEPGLIIIGAEGMLLEGAPHTTVEHILHYADPPITVRFRKAEPWDLAEDPEPGQRDVEFSKKDYSNGAFKFDTHTEAGTLLVSESSLPYLKKDEILIGINGVDVRNCIHSQALYMLRQTALNLGPYKGDTKNKNMTLRVAVRDGGFTLDEDDAGLESERSELTNADTLEDMFGPKKSKMSVNMVMKLKKKFTKKKLGKIKPDQYDITLSNTHGLELCGGPVYDKDGAQEGSVVYHKDKMLDKKSRKILTIGDRVVGVDGLDLYSAEHHEIDYLVFEQMTRGKKKLRLEHIKLPSLNKVLKKGEVDVNLTFEDIMHIPWTGKTDFDACIKDALPEDHPGTIAGLGKGDRLVGINETDVTLIPFNGVLKLLKKTVSDKKAHVLRFKNLPESYWGDFSS